MAQLTIDGQVFNYPDNGSESGLWGEDAAAWATAITNAVNNAPGLAGAITETSTSTLINKILNGPDNTVTNLNNSNISSSAEIELTKLATITGNKALQTNSSGFITTSSVTSTELGYVSGVSSAIQTQLNNIVASISALLLTPTGSVFPFAGSSAPTSYLMCYGQNVSRITYSALFSVIGTTYGVGDGSTTFTIPDLRGRAVAGKDDMGGSSAGRITSGGSGIVGTTLGATGGLETHTLNTSQLPSHTHTLGSHTHTTPAHSHNITSGTLLSLANHQHATSIGADTGGIYWRMESSNTGGFYGSRVIAAPGTNTVKTAALGSTNVNIRENYTSTGTELGSGFSSFLSDSTTTNGPSTNSSDSTGSGAAHNNTQPTIMLNYIIKT